ncbi:uncharacterized protein N7518_002229 [Penicillium psychrosexuale]|uniref:uncharacterized protein n=1 Tax=Penicillium psychrosexuale TaxID=1002107 RepID=UPI0025458E6B|nr:uncharacterized protein N7518_002229 [Penicillium psychrosexuale]KAJ5800161.1 hypothetical protein N7518_002229 [Penicillium psychrosexuale]
MANLFRRLRKRFQSRRSRRSQLAELEQELCRAFDAVYDLQLRLIEFDFMLAHTTSSNPTLAVPPLQSDSQSLSDIPRTISPTGITPTSMDDIWLCSYSGSLLVDAEERWRHDDPELAMELASQVIRDNPFLCELDEMRCRLFIAAVQHHLCQFKESMMSLEMVVQINSCYAVLNNPESRIIAGITHFIKGMNLMKLHRFPDAYLSLSRAQVIPGYIEKAREVQREAVIGFTRIEAAEFDHSPAASTHALLDWEDGR